MRTFCESTSIVMALPTSDCCVLQAAELDLTTVGDPEEQPAAFVAKVCCNAMFTRSD